VIQFNQQICGSLDAAIQREWLETNGLGGFASSTIIGLNTRRYHGLLTAATNPPVGRMLLLAKLEETVVIDGRRFELAANRYPGVVHPEGYRHLKEFRLDPFPIFTFEVEGVEIEKRVFLVYGENTVVVEYELRLPQGAPAPDCLLEVRPLIAFRDYHSTTHQNRALNSDVKAEPGLATVAPYQGSPSLHLAHDAGELKITGHWYHNFEYDVERERGLDYLDDLFNPFLLRFPLHGRRTAAIIASTERRAISQAAGFRQAEVQRRKAVLEASPHDDSLVRALVAAADQYIVKRGDLKTVIAGYHWFSDWGRDTMIALPGLTLATGRTEVAKSILLAFAGHVDRGMLPNRFPDAGEAPEYNTVDATLWFFHAVQALLQYTGDYPFVRSHLYPVLAGIIDWHSKGTRYGIRVEEDGLIAAGEPGAQLTWMDARIGDWVVTPRHGKPVEIQALWYHALRIMEDLARRFDDPAAAQYGGMAAHAHASFNNLFWNEQAGCLYDVVNGELRDGSIRPNQIFAVSLPHTMVSAERAARVVEVVQRELLTPYGLRSLASGDPQYRPRYTGDPRSRDSAYHQGTVWPWLMGHFITAYLKVSGHSAGARRQAAQWLAVFQEYLTDRGVGQLPEIFDADAPHHPRGCLAQAWSVAELLRAAVEDVFAVSMPTNWRLSTSTRPPGRQGVRKTDPTFTLSGS